MSSLDVRIKTEMVLIYGLGCRCYPVTQLLFFRSYFSQTVGVHDEQNFFTWIDNICLLLFFFTCFSVEVHDEKNFFTWIDNICLLLFFFTYFSVEVHDEKNFK